MSKIRPLRTFVSLKQVAMLVVGLSSFTAHCWPPSHAAEGSELQEVEDPPPTETRNAYVIPWKPAGSESWLFRTKRRLRYHTIADFAPSSALLMSHSQAWEPIIQDIIREVDVPVYLVSEDQDQETSLRSALRRWGQNPKQQVHSLAYDVDSAWVRDYGPIQQISTKTGRIRWLDGDYHHDRILDDGLPIYLSRVAEVPTKQLLLSMEGGALVSNGRGLCASTEEYIVSAGLYHHLLVPKRREKLLSDLGCSTLVLVPALPDEETKHIDLFVQFVKHNRIIVGDVDQSRWPKAYHALRVAKQRLLKAARVNGLHLKLSSVLIPQIENEIYYSYINGIRINRRFLVPSFSQVSSYLEQQGYEQLSKAMPGVDIVPIDVRELPQHLGLLHCIVLGLNLPQKSLARMRKPKNKPRRTRRPIRS